MNTLNPLHPCHYKPRYLLFIILTYLKRILVLKARITKKLTIKLRLSNIVASFRNVNFFPPKGPPHVIRIILLYFYTLVLYISFFTNWDHFSLLLLLLFLLCIKGLGLCAILWYWSPTVANFIFDFNIKELHT